ncbi:MAG: DEAD/DEAH box helicase [Crocinitomicaceae bacterium]|jgi:superfamily II DNA/RNA helicase|nr:DEAD/DEAH box helicase [Crocinitomicaceae bacterium]MCF8433165.1 DEAD/DEAH box helicase [Crocinitomicaceae bacterium]
MSSLSILRKELAEIMPDFGMTELNPFQVSILEAFKSGKNLLIEGPEGTGKSTAIMVAALQKITEASEGSPRAIIVCSTDQKAKDLKEKFASYGRYFDLTVDLITEKGKMLHQRNDLFDGTEIIVGTPKRLYELYLQNGYNVSKMKLFVLDDAIELFKGGFKMQIGRLADSLPKCQHLLFSTTFNDYRIEEYLEEYVPITQHVIADTE